jgi:RNA polymerase-binding transcription factor DksA
MLTEIETVSHRIHMDRLVNRRDRVMTRIRTVDDQLRQLEQNALLRDDNGSRERRNLLTYLSSFHRTEVDQLDSALKRLAMGKYGVCLACSGEVEADWLESFPAGEVCSTCYRIQDRMAAG